RAMQQSRTQTISCHTEDRAHSLSQRVDLVATFNTYGWRCFVRIRSAMTRFSMLSFSLALAACQSPSAEPEDIVLDPTSLDEAGKSLDQIERLQKVDPEAAERAMDSLRPRLDQLNHLIARVEPMPGHVVSFYETQ